MADFNWADWGLLGIIVFSSLISLMRGFTKEALSLVVWLLAFVVARSFHPQAQTLLSSSVDDPMLLAVAAFALLFIATLLVGSLLSYLGAFLIKVTGLTTFDRVLGVVFGMARGVIVCVVIVALLRYTPWSNSAWWTSSPVIEQLTIVEYWSRSVLGASASELSSTLANVEL